MGIRGLHSIWRATSGLLIIALFALAPFIHGWADLLAEHEHEHSISHCSPEAELDACHRLIFHHDHAKGCEHSHHIEQAFQHCSLCAVVASLAIGIEDSPCAVHLPAKKKYSVSAGTDEGPRSVFSHSIPTRGPPSF